MEKRSRRRTRDLVTQAASQGLSENEIGCARIHDGQEQKRSMQGPDTDAQDQPPPFIQIRLATHGRSIQLGQTQKSDCSAKRSALPSITDIIRPARLVRFVPQPAGLMHRSRAARRRLGWTL